MIETEFGDTRNQDFPTPGKALERTRELIAERSQRGLRDLLFRYVLIPVIVTIGIFGLLRYVTTGEGGAHDIGNRTMKVSSAP